MSAEANGSKRPGRLPPGPRRGGDTPLAPPPGVRATPPAPAGATRVVLVRHGEAACNVDGTVGGRRGCFGLTRRGVAQVTALRDRLARTGELAGVDALYASMLPRAIETADILAPALDAWRDGPPLQMATDCALCELHPGEADGLDWREVVERFGEPDWDAEPDRPIAPGGESWTGFVARASGAVADVAAAHPGGLVVIACHAGVVEATLIAYLGIERSRARRGWVRTDHASTTEWEWGDGRWVLRRYNDVTPTVDRRAGAQQA